MFFLLISGNLLMASIYILKFSHLPLQIPFFYSKPWGEDQLVDTWFILFLPIILNLLVFFNYTVIKKLFGHNDLINKITYYLNLFLIILTTYVFIRIIFLVS